MLSLVALAMVSAAAFGQRKYTTDFPAGKKVLSITVTSADLKVTTHSGSNIEVIATGDDWEDPRDDERAEGLKLISAVGEDNTEIGMYELREDGMVSLTQLGNRSRSYEVRVPKETSLILNESTWQGDGFVVEGVSGEVEVTTKNGDIVLRNVTGPIVANAMNGDIDVIFASVSQSNPTSINATNGAIDITFPTATKAELKISTMNGEIFSNLDMAMERKENELSMIGGSSIKGTLNGGGVRMDLRAMNGDIYLRKK